MRILLLGGSWFLGRSVAQAALARGWSVTTFNRGRSAPDLKGVEPLRGDRTRVEDLEALVASGPWDAVVDTSASELAPRQVLEAASLLEPVAARYVYISTVNAYMGWPNEPLTEASATYPAPADADRDFGADKGVTLHYGMQKAGAEVAVQAVFGERSTVLRPGVILGPQEYVGRLPWWLHRAERGGKILAPGRAGQPIQPVDVRDVADFALLCAAKGGGPYNLAAPPERDTMGDFLQACLEVTGSTGELVWADDEVLGEAGVREWTELPLWRTSAGAWAVDASAARAAGFVCRPLAETVRDTWDWLRGGERPVAHPRWDDHGIDPVKEAEIITSIT